MLVHWLGQSAFHLTVGPVSVLIDPFDEAGKVLAARGVRFAYPVQRDLPADLLIVTHEHIDHTGVGVAAGEPQIIRSTAGTFPTPVGTLVSIASEHDNAAGTQRGPNSIVVFDFGGLRVCHCGDFGQSELREEQAAAIGTPDLLFVPVGGGPTIDGEHAAAIARQLGARWVVPMHYRTGWIDFLEPIDGFLGAFSEEERVILPSSEFTTEALPVYDAPIAIVPSI